MYFSVKFNESYECYVLLSTMEVARKIIFTPFISRCSQKRYHNELSSRGAICQLNCNSGKRCRSSLYEIVKAT